LYLNQRNIFDKNLFIDYFHKTTKMIQYSGRLFYNNIFLYKNHAVDKIDSIKFNSIADYDIFVCFLKNVIYMTEITN